MPSPRICISYSLDGKTCPILLRVRVVRDPPAWTSSGAGDLRRARAAAERLVMLCSKGGTSLYCPREKRDLAVLLAGAYTRPLLGLT